MVKFPGGTREEMESIRKMLQPQHMEILEKLKLVRSVLSDLQADLHLISFIDFGELEGAVSDVDCLALQLADFALASRQNFTLEDRLFQFSN